MIPLHKLERLPRHQSLRKIGKIFTQAEQELSLHGKSALPLEYLQSLAAMLAADPLFPAAVSRELISVKTAIAGLSPESPALHVLVRSCNSIRHILLAETGRQTADWDFIDHTGNLDPQRRTAFSGMKVFLEDIRSPFNVGSMFRTAESFGAEKVVLSPLCADPNHQRAQRTAMGCISAVPWERQTLEELESPIFVLETGGTGLEDFIFPRQGTMIVGSEELGASPKALELAEKSLGRVSIQTYGAKGSLNVGVAFGIAMQAWAAQLADGKGT